MKLGHTGIPEAVDPTKLFLIFYNFNFTHFNFASDSVSDVHHGTYKCDASSSYNEVTYGPGSASIDVDVRCKTLNLSLFNNSNFF